jgi:hypothetical protein
MSLIAAWVDDTGNITMGADTRVVSDYDICSSDDLKIFHVGEALVGISGQLRFLQYVKYGRYGDSDKSGIIREIHSDEDANEYIFSIASVLKDAAKDNSFASDDDCISSRILIGLRGKLYTVGTSFEIVIHPERYAAIGYDTHALGIMSYLDKSNSQLQPLEILQKALAITSERNASVGPPYVFISTQHSRVIRHNGINITSNDNCDHVFGIFIQHPSNLIMSRWGEVEIKNFVKYRYDNQTSYDLYDWCPLCGLKFDWEKYK